MTELVGGGGGGDRVHAAARLYGFVAQVSLGASLRWFGSRAGVEPRFVAFARTVRMSCMGCFFSSLPLRCVSVKRFLIQRLPLDVARRYICREWNRHNFGAQMLKRHVLYYSRQENFLDYTRGPWEHILLHDHICF